MKPIIFSTPMVQAILAGRKTMTRRVMKKPPCKEADRFIKIGIFAHYKPTARFGNEKANAVCDRDIPYAVGDTLWVRETWCEFPKGVYHYMADSGAVRDEHFHQLTDIKWRPSIFMPHEAARIFLRVTDVRAERLLDISEDDAIAEGCRGTTLDGVPFISARGSFHALWDNLNAKRGYGWDTNPWVWVISFERSEG